MYSLLHILYYFFTGDTDTFTPVACNMQDTAQKIRFSIKDLFSKCDQIRRKLRIWSHLPKKSLMGNFILCAARHKYIRVLVVIKHNKKKN